MRDSGWWIAGSMAAAGVLVSGYLLVLALRGSAPTCLVGSCDRVTASPYSQLLGLPISGWGALLYLVIAAVAVSGGTRRRARVFFLPALLGLAVFGAVFSVYLMWLQIGVIQALCAWCATSAAIMALLLATTALLVRAEMARERAIER